MSIKAQNAAALRRTVPYKSSIIGLLVCSAPRLKLNWSSQPRTSESKHIFNDSIQRFAIEIPPAVERKKVTPVFIRDVSGLALSSHGAAPPTPQAHSL